MAEQNRGVFVVVGWTAVSALVGTAVRALEANLIPEWVAFGMVGGGLAGMIYTWERLGRIDGAETARDAARAERDAAIKARDAIAEREAVAAKTAAEAIQNYDRLADQQNEFRDATERALAPHGLWLARWGTDKAGNVNVEFRKVTAETAPCQDAPGDDVTGTPPGESDV